MTGTELSSSHILVTGGRAKSNATRLPEWQGFHSGLILAVDPAERAVRTCATYQSPPQLCPASDPSFVFKAGTIRKEKLYVCTQTEVLIYSLPDFTILHHLSHPWFNDLHHVLPLDDERLLVAVTGLDMVIEIDLAGQVLRSWNVLAESRFTPGDIDLRRVPTTKPHLSHPNHLFLLGDEIWVTRFIQRDAICLNSPNKRIKIRIGSPHDGVVADQKIYFTTVEGHVVIADRSNPDRLQVFDLNENRGSGRSVGWCRGIKILRDDRIVVGFSRLRPTRWQIGANLLKAASSLSSRGHPHPTRLACYNVSKFKLEWEMVLERYQMNAVFSIL